MYSQLEFSQNTCNLNCENHKLCPFLKNSFKLITLNCWKSDEESIVELLYFLP